MVGSYQTITYNRHAVQSATKFKAKIVDVPFCDPESGFAILIAVSYTHLTLPTKLEV